MLSAEIEGVPVTVILLPDAVGVVVGIDVIVCVIVRRRVRVDVLVTKSGVGDTLVETLADTLGVRLTVVD